MPNRRLGPSRNHPFNQAFNHPCAPLRQAVPANLL